jgi:hypothetical protein
VSLEQARDAYQVHAVAHLQALGGMHISFCCDEGRRLMAAWEAADRAAHPRWYPARRPRKLLRIVDEAGRALL